MLAAGSAGATTRQAVVKSTPLLEVRNASDHRVTKPPPRRRPLEINLDRRFHGVVLSEDRST
jgi:hypothetical protein